MKNKIDFEKDNILLISNEKIDIDDFKKDNDYHRQKIREKIEPWLAAVFQSEHLSLLVGSGLPIALNSIKVENTEKRTKSKDNKDSTDNENSMMNRIKFENTAYKDLIKNKADKEAKQMDREEANFEDDLRVAIELLKGYEILGNSQESESLKQEINKYLNQLIQSRLKNEQNFFSKQEALLILKKFLLSFSARSATRDRLNIFTTNYDRFIEYGLDEAGILTLDRFIGKLKPIMRFHRIDLDYHYNPPGIRGEPRYVEGVVRYTKLHGSLDWKFEDGNIVKMPIPFGAEVDEEYFNNPFDKVVIYPNSSKAVETSFFPYSELFRDFSTAICRPNSVLVTYGYGFGDSHINRIIGDMLTIPSTHLVIISYDLANNRIKKFIEKCNESQLTLLIGKELSNIEHLTNYYLPKPAIDKISDRQTKILEKRKSIIERKENDINIKDGDSNETEF
jgi:hypothetical protein